MPKAAARDLLPDIGLRCTRPLLPQTARSQTASASRRLKRRDTYSRRLPVTAAGMVLFVAVGERCIAAAGGLGILDTRGVHRTADIRGKAVAFRRRVAGGIFHVVVQRPEDGRARLACTALPHRYAHALAVLADKTRMRAASRIAASPATVDLTSCGALAGAKNRTGRGVGQGRAGRESKKSDNCDEKTKKSAVHLILPAGV